VLKSIKLALEIEPDILRDPDIAAGPTTLREPVISAEPVKGKPAEVGRFVKPLPSPVKNEAVTALDTLRDLNVASEPLTISLRQLGIRYLLSLSLRY
jgi:hypothetical protein